MSYAVRHWNKVMMQFFRSRRIILLYEKYFLKSNFIRIVRDCLEILESEKIHSGDSSGLKYFLLELPQESGNLTITCVFHLSSEAEQRNFHFIRFPKQFILCKTLTCTTDCTILSVVFSCPDVLLVWFEFSLKELIGHTIVGRCTFSRQNWNLK